MFGPEPLEPDRRLAAHTLVADKGRVGTGAAVLGLGGVTLSMSAACPGGQLTISEGADLSPDTRKQHGLDFPHGWRRVPLQAGRAPTTVDGDLQQQPVAQALNTLQHSLLGRCGCLVWPAGLNPPGRPPRRLAGSEFEIAELQRRTACQRPRLWMSLWITSESKTIQPLRCRVMRMPIRSLPFIEPAFVGRVSSSARP